MKLLLIFVFTFVTIALSQDDQTVTSDLLAAQTDLSLGHRFFETSLAENRAEVSKYISTINQALLDEHISSYESMKNLSIETHEGINLIEVNERNEECLDNVRNRWNLQITR